MCDNRDTSLFVFGRNLSKQNYAPLQVTQGPSKQTCRYVPIFLPEFWPMIKRERARESGKK